MNKLEMIARVTLMMGFAASGLLPAQTSLPPREILPPMPLQPPVVTTFNTERTQEEFGRIVQGGEAVNAVDISQFDESVDLSTGKTEFTATDVSLPGNSAIPVAFGRTRSIENHGGTFFRALGDWEMDIPYMEAVFIKGRWNQPPEPQGWIVAVPDVLQRQNRCSAPQSPQEVQPPSYYEGTPEEFSPREFWQGIHLHAPGQGRQEVLMGGTNNPFPDDGRVYRYVTSGRWYLACDGGLPDGQPGDGYIARSPDGLIYRFNRMVTDDYAGISRVISTAQTSWTDPYDRQRIRLYPSSVEDRYGNLVTYTWTAGKLTGISANDGRELTLAWNGLNGTTCVGSTGVLCRVSDGVRTWSYGYSFVSGGPYSRLTSVTLPDASQWLFDFQDISWGRMDYVNIPGAIGNQGYDTSLGCNWMRVLDNNQRSARITHPAGATAVFGFDVKRHGRTKVGLNCNEVTDSRDERGHFPSIPARFDVWAITDKTVTGPGIASPYVWIYRYALPIGSFLPPHGSTQPQRCPRILWVRAQPPKPPRSSHRTAAIRSTRMASSGKRTTASWSALQPTRPPTRWKAARPTATSPTQRWAVRFSNPPWVRRRKPTSWIPGWPNACARSAAASSRRMALRSTGL